MKSNKYFSKKSEKNEYPLTVGQKGLWFLHQLDPLSDRYHMPLTFKFNNQVNVDDLEKILTVFIQRHSMMNSTFHEVDGAPVRRINVPQAVRMTEHDVTDLKHQGLLQKIRKLSGKPFNLENGPLLRAHVLHGFQGGRILLITIHHLIFDGASLKLLCDEMELIYRSFINDSQLQAVEYDYNDFQTWQQQWLQSEDAQLSQGYWLKKLAGELPQLNLPIDYASNKNEIIKGEFLKFSIPKSIVDNFKQLALDTKCSEYLIWLTIYFAFLSRYTSQKDLIVGTPSMGRPEAQFDEFIGYFVNLIPIRCQLHPHENFIDLLHRFKNDIYEALMHADYPLPELISALGDANQRGDQPLFQTSFIWTVTEHLKSESDSQLGLEIYPLLHESGEQNLSLEVITSEEGISCLLKYRTNCFSAASVSRIKQSFLNFIDSISIEPDCEIQELSLVTEDDENFLLHTLNETNMDYPNEWCIHQLFEEQVKKTPDEVAIIFEERSLSYTELNQQANQLAHYLIEQGVKTDSLVGLCLKRSPEMIVA
ncbi:MAG: AMP-binding protein, partial [Alcanivoracaceae bacterium]|nr:AMP-binding protein [Alcanivoracaceae bacterium]